MKIGFVSLGCSKNLMDTEMAIGLFKKNQFEIVQDPRKAEMIVINTCGFIDSAKEEAINTILEMAAYKEKKCQYLVVMGCLVQRYEKELKKSLPEVDLWIPIAEYENLWEKIEKLIGKNQKEHQELQYLEREITTGNTTAYLKIAEGCSNHCTYCTIPMIRGPFISRKLEEVIEEAKWLSKKGIKELIVIAQDTTKYGMDIYGKPMLAKLLEELEKIEDIKWIRFLYAYPETITEELIEVVAKSTKICHYFDIPIQHISNPILKKMNRKSDKESIYRLIENLREKIPDVIIRTTLIVGFPGESEENFEELVSFIKIMKLDRVGVFQYSKEEGTPAARLKEQIHPQTKKRRYREIMQIQQEIAEESGKAKIGKQYEILIENISFDKKYLIGRSYMDVPEMDGNIYIENPEKEDFIGEFIKAEITGYEDYDLIGKKI